MSDPFFNIKPISSGSSSKKKRKKDKKPKKERRSKTPKVQKPTAPIKVTPKPRTPPIKVEKHAATPKTPATTPTQPRIELSETLFSIKCCLNDLKEGVEAFILGKADTTGIEGFIYRGAKHLEQTAINSGSSDYWVGLNSTLGELIDEMGGFNPMMLSKRVNDVYLPAKFLSRIKSSEDFEREIVISNLKIMQLKDDKKYEEIGSRSNGITDEEYIAIVRLNDEGEIQTIEGIAYTRNAKIGTIMEDMDEALEKYLSSPGVKEEDLLTVYLPKRKTDQVSIMSFVKALYALSYPEQYQE